MIAAFQKFNKHKMENITFQFLNRSTSLIFLSLCSRFDANTIWILICMAFLTSSDQSHHRRPIKTLSFTDRNIRQNVTFSYDVEKSAEVLERTWKRLTILHFFKTNCFTFRYLLMVFSLSRAKISNENNIPGPNITN